MVGVIEMETADRNPLRCVCEEVTGRCFEVAAHAGLHREYVRGTGGQYSEGHPGVYHSFGNLVDGAVATRGYDQTDAISDGTAREADGGARTGCRQQNGFVARLAENTPG